MMARSKVVYGLPLFTQRHLRESHKVLYTNKVDECIPDVASYRTNNINAMRPIVTLMAFVPFWKSIRR
jgi:hypothetical protein